jgi:hypothetical protein
MSKVFDKMKKRRRRPTFALAGTIIGPRKLNGRVRSWERVFPFRDG